MRKDGKAERQHYVPKMLLRPFSHVSGSERVHVFDKHSAREWPGATSINKVLAERDFYVTQNPYGDEVSLEHALTELEQDAEPAIRRIIERQSLIDFADQDRATLSLFIAVQLMRTPRMRAAQKQVADASLKIVKANHPDASNIHEFEQMASEEALKFGSMLQVADAGVYAQILFKHHWILLKTDGLTFWTSDCPVTQHNDKKFGPYGNIGLAVPGIQIYMPISPRLSLGLWERGVVSELRQGAAEAERLYKSNRATNAILARPADLTASGEQIERVRRTIDGIETGAAINADIDAVTFGNYLQYYWSARFLVASVSDFDLARKIAAERPELRDGARLKVN